MIEKCGQLASNIGRSATAYQINSLAQIAVGIEIFEESVNIVAINLYGKVEAKDFVTLKFCANSEYLENLSVIVKWFLQKYNYEEKQVLGIGLGIQGITFGDGSEITYGSVLDYINLSIYSFSEKFSVPCRFVRDVECLAKSELWENPEIKDAIFLSLGYQVSGAIIIDGVLRNGITGKNGALGHMTLIPDGRVCYCGKKGCVDSYCSGRSLLTSEMQLKEFLLQKKQEKSYYKQKWNEYLDYLSILINNLHMIIDGYIVLGGQISTYFTEQDICDIQNKVFKRALFKESVDYIIQGKCKKDAVPIGAAISFIKSFLENVYYFSNNEKC